MLDPHIGDLAERYVLGDLDASEVAALEEHIAVCAACLRRVGEAEETILALERGDIAEIAPPRRKPFVAMAAGIAAAFVVGVLATLLAQSLHTDDTQRALLAMVGSHFNHAQFASVASQSAPPAKVIYARDKRWLFIVATGTERYGVYAVSPAGTTLLGNLHPEGSSSTLYVDHPGAPNSIELRDGATVLERAALR
jgi:anti-sigma-K factor RskA